MTIVPADATTVDDPAELVAFFGDHPDVHVYALADLEAPYWEPSTWIRRGDAVVGLVRLPDSDAITVYAVSTRDPEATLALLGDTASGLPAGTLVTGPVGLGGALRPWREIEWEGPHVRYILRSSEMATAGGGDVDVRPLDPSHVPDLAELHATEPGAAFFLPHMVEDETFVGVYEDGRLVAAAGTHVLSVRHRCAAIGAVYTVPSHRGRGLGRSVTAGAVGRVVGRADVIGLNVAEENLAARAVYERLGFEPVLRYAEAEVR